MIRQIEEFSINAWPAPTQIVYDGWIVRFGGGYTRRANSVHPLYPGTLSLDEKIAKCEGWYRERGLDVVFKLTNAAEPGDLDAQLERRGYSVTGRTGVWMAELPDACSNVDAAAQACGEANQEWIAAAGELSGITESKQTMLRKIVQGIALPARFVVMREDNETVACGMAVCQNGYIGLFDIITKKEYRRRGWATRLLSDLMAWGKNKKAEHAYLQVVVENEGARRLYERLGFVEVYQYWYRARA